ncbi:hypothetical protein, partial [Pseudomonas sp. SIMBA_021]
MHPDKAIHKTGVFRMQQRHKHLLHLKLDQLWSEGVVRIDRWEMLAIFDKQKVTVADWRLFGEYWDEFCGSPTDAAPLQYVKIMVGE